MTAAAGSTAVASPPLAVVRSEASRVDAFAAKVSVFIAQEVEDDSVANALKELAALRAPAEGLESTSPSVVAKLIEEAARNTTGRQSFEARFCAVVRVYGISRWEEWWLSKDWQVLRSPLVEAALNHVLSMSEMLTEERAATLRKVVETKSCERSENRLKNIEHEPLTDADEEWRKQLEDWRELLQPYPWDRVRSQMMSFVLGSAQLQEPLTQHVLLVRSYEFLRCLGGALLAGQNALKQNLDKIQCHGETFGCWCEGEITSATLNSYVQDVIGVDSSEDSRERHSVLAQIGFAPRVVRSRRFPIVLLGKLACRLIKQVSADLRSLCETSGLCAVWQKCEHLLNLAQKVVDKTLVSTEHADDIESIREFLLGVARDYIERTSSSPSSRGLAKTINFGLLAQGDVRFEMLHVLESQKEMTRSLDDMALHELIDLMKLIHEAFDMVHGTNHLPKVVELWMTRLGDGPSALHPSDMGDLSAALQDFLRENCRVCKVNEEDSLASCVARALGSSGMSLQSEGDDMSFAIGQYTAPYVEATRHIVACFGAREVCHNAKNSSTSPVVVRSVPLGLCDGGDDYEVREIGLRIGGMYRMVSRDKVDSAGSGSLALHYEWVSPTEVREDSKPLEKILAGVSRVRIYLQEGKTVEEREVDLQTNRVYGDSTWYRTIPSRPRTSADDHGGFRRFVVEVGRGLRLPLPNGLLQGSPGVGVIETADVLAHVLALWFSQKHSREEIAKELRERPALLYFASTALFERFDHLASTFTEALESYWVSVLGVSAEASVAGEAPSTVVQREAQETLLQLIVARPDGRLCAILSSAHLNEFCSLAEKTRHSIEFLAVEKFCFESALERIRTFEDSTVTIIVIDVTGQLSALQLAELVRHASNSVRLVLNWYHGLVPSLTMTRSTSRIIIPASLEGDANAHVSPTAYQEAFALGQATMYSARILNASPTMLSPLAGVQFNQDGTTALEQRRDSTLDANPLDWMRNLREAHEYLRSCNTWAEQEALWRTNARTHQKLQANDALMLLVSADEALVRGHFDNLPPSDAVQCFSLQHADKKVLAQIDAVLGRTAGDVAQKFTPRTTLVLFGATFIAPSKLEDIIACAFLGGRQVVLVVTEPTTALRSVRVTTRHSTQYVHATVLSVRHLPQSASLASRALRLALGHEALASERELALQAAFDGDDMSTCADIVQCGFKSENGRDLVAGIMHTLNPGSKARPSDSRSLAFAIGCLAAAFVRRSVELGLDHHTWDISFPEFRAHMPICRFLDQVSVLEAWCRYLDFTHVAEGSITGSGLPEGTVVWPHRSPQRHFILSQWEPNANVHAVGLEEFLDHSLVRECASQIQMLQPTYIGTGPTHHSEAHEEVLERHSSQQRELDWAQFSESWRTALDIKPGLFLKLAAFGVDTLRLFLCLPPERAIELGLTHLSHAACSERSTPQMNSVTNVARRLLSDMECSVSLLDVAVKQGADELGVRLAALKWLLLITLPERDAMTMLSGVCRIDEATVAYLVRAKIILAPKGRTELLRRVVSLVVGLDGGDVLGSQHEIRTFLLNTTLPLLDLLSDSTAQIGRAIVSFLFSPDHTDQLKKREIGCAVVDSFERLFGFDVLNWQSLDDPELVEAAQPQRISAAAHASVLERAPDPTVCRALASGPLIMAISRLLITEGPEVADAFLCRVLENLPKGSDTRILAVMETLSQKQSSIANVMSQLQVRPGKGPLRSSKNMFLPELFLALQSQDLGSYLTMVSTRAHLGSSPVQLALDGHPCLQKLYVKHFGKMAKNMSDADALNIHNTILDDTSCTALFNYLIAQGKSVHVQASEVLPSDMFLLWYCWSRSPDRQLPLWALPREQGDTFTLALNSGAVSFVERCRPIGVGLSVLAKYLVAPESLPLGVFNTLAGQVPWVHSDKGSLIIVQTVLLGQEDCEDYPPYCIRWYSRMLPLPLREKLIRKCRDDVSKSVDASSHHFYPRITSGVNEQTFRQNLGLLQALDQDNEHLAVYFDHGAESQRQFVAACILCWFKASGFSYDDLYACVKPAEKESFTLFWQALHKSFRKVGATSLRKNYIRGPLPADIDVRWVEDGVSNVPIFARTRDSALLTAQWLNMLIVHFSLSDLQPFTPEDLVVVGGNSGGGGLSSGPRLDGALDAISNAIGIALCRDLLADAEHKQLMSPLSDDKYDTMKLVTLVAVLTDFVSLLRSTPGSIKKFFNGLIYSFSQCKPAPSSVHFAALFDAFFSLLAVTPDNCGFEIEELALAYKASELPVSDKVLEEIRWMHEHYYGRRDRTSDVVTARLPTFEPVCARLTRIRKLQLGIVAFHRQYQNPLFVGELLGEQTACATPYSQQRFFQLLCEKSCCDGRKANSYDDVPSSLDSTFSLAEQDYFVASGEENGNQRGGGNAHRQLEWPGGADAVWSKTHPIVSAPDIMEIDASRSFYLHAVLRVRAGLQPILWNVDTRESFYRLSGLSCNSTQSHAICKAFSTNASAWQFIDRAVGAVVTCDGFYLRKADDGVSWLVVFPSARSPDEPALVVGDMTLRQRRYCIWPICQSHKLANLGITNETLRVLQLVVWIAWYMVEKAADVGAVPDFEPGNIMEPLESLSDLSNFIERFIATQELPEGDEELVRSARQVHRYQQNERHLVEVLIRILSRVKAQQRDDLGGLIRAESQRRPANTVPFVNVDGQSLSSLGRILQRLLVPITSKASIAGSPATTKSWTQLELILESCFRGEQLPHERCFAKHMHITKSSFAKKGVDILRGLNQATLESHCVPMVQHFSDSEDEGMTPSLQEKAHASEESADVPSKVQRFEARSDFNYVDTSMDRDRKSGIKLFDHQDGFGRPLSSRHAPLTFYDEDLPLYFVSLNRERLKIDYSAAEGMCLGYLVHKNVFAELLEDAKRDGNDGLKTVRMLRNRLLLWVVDILRSPLSNETKSWILRCCERMGMVAVAPYQEVSHVNVVVIAYCLCRCCPSGTDSVLFLRTVLMNAWHIPTEIGVFIERKSDIYGLYVAKPGTLQKMRDLGLQVAIRDFERESWQRSLNNSAMYLDIISHFSSYCCFVYVKGLQKVDDILLKWLAEYTRLHPWRFVYLESIDTTFNFPENRDRCNFRFAPANPLHSIETMEELQSPQVADMRPSHTITYPQKLQPMPEDVQEPKRLCSFFANQLREDGAADASSNLFSSFGTQSALSLDFRDEFEEYLFASQACLVLLVSSPGAGKTHHIGGLRGRLEGEMHLDIHEFDGSSDILVTTALAEVLQRTITTQNSASQKLLILDEYHMLSDEHKDELFEWLRHKLGPSLRVVLIANRIDSKDRERLEQSRSSANASGTRVGLIRTRLSRPRIESIMEARGNAMKWRDHICDWLVASRCIFGEESVSLRLCDTLEEILKKPDPRLALIDLLLNRVPTISRPTAAEFVVAFLQHIGIRSHGTSASANGLVGLCFRVAMLDRWKDELCSFAEFLERTPRAHEAPPAVRLLAWIVYMMNACNRWDINLISGWMKRRLFVDQVNFPFELGQENMGTLSSSGPAFSWSGDPSSLRDLVDAVKRGHSVDWVAVHKKVWSVDQIKDSELFAQLLSSSHNPGVILQQVLPANLCSMLRLSNTAAPTAVQLARIILKHAPHGESDIDRPRSLALWTIILHDQQAQTQADILKLAGGAVALYDVLMWARDWASDRRTTASPATRSRLLQQALVLTSVQTSFPVSVQNLTLLWTGSFGRLLRGPTLEQEEAWEGLIAGSIDNVSVDVLASSGIPPALPLAKMRQVLQHVADVQEDWSNEVQAMWRIGHSRSTAKEISDLWSVAPHLLQDLQKKRTPIHEDFIHGIVNAPGTLCRSLQRVLLCSNCHIPESVSTLSFASACADALNEMRNADQMKQVCIGGPVAEAMQQFIASELSFL